MKKNNYIRIIGGRWRSRRLRCVESPGLRPSPDSVRETLFNWLPHDLRGATCLDLFAGSGALGFEAASRGADKIVMVESSRKAIAMLRENHAALHDDARIKIIADSAQKFMQQPQKNDAFDIIFIDPPFADNLIKPTCETLIARGFLSPDALVYIESPHAKNPLPIPADWHIIRSNRCGMVQSTLIQT